VIETGDRRPGVSTATTPSAVRDDPAATACRRGSQRARNARQARGRPSGGRAAAGRGGRCWRQKAPGASAVGPCRRKMAQEAGLLEPFVRIDARQAAGRRKETDRPRPPRPSSAVGGVCRTPDAAVAQHAEALPGQRGAKSITAMPLMPGAACAAAGDRECRAPPARRWPSMPVASTRLARAAGAPAARWSRPSGAKAGPSAVGCDPGQGRAVAHRQGRLCAGNQVRYGHPDLARARRTSHLPRGRARRSASYQARGLRAGNAELGAGLVLGERRTVMRAVVTPRPFLARRARCVDHQDVGARAGPARRPRTPTARPGLAGARPRTAS